MLRFSRSFQNLSEEKNSEKIGLMRAGAGVLMLSIGAALVRLAGVSAWNVAFWRGFLIAISLTGFLFLTGKIKSFLRLKHFGHVAWVVCLVYGFNSALFVFAVLNTKVANVMVILCSTPFFSALLSWVMMRQKLPLRTWGAMVAVIAGVLIVFSGSVSLNGWQGDLMALVLAISTSFLFTYLHRYSEFPRIPAIAIGAGVSSLVMLPWSAPLAIPVASIGWLALLGLVQKPAASVLMLTATRYISSPQVSLFMLLEIVLAPFWAWLAVSESVPTWTSLGGSVVIVAVATHCFLELKEERTASD